MIETKKLLSLPLNGRSYIDLLGLQAGVIPVTSGSMQQDRPVSGDLSAGNVSVNGQRETANAFLVNGSDVSEGRNLGAGLIPNLDSIAEFRLITNSFDAEYGRFSGSVMNAITKSGTNGFHGAAFEFLRNDHFDARNFFDPTKAELRQNQFGYAVGGPFWKNRIFWFTDYQGTRQVAGASTGLVSVPTDAQRAGNFGAGAFVDANGNPNHSAGRILGASAFAAAGLGPVQNGEAIQCRVSEWRDSAISVVGAVDRHFALHSRSQSPVTGFSPTPARRRPSTTTRLASAWTSTIRRPVTGRSTTTTTGRAFTTRWRPPAFLVSRLSRPPACIWAL